MKTASRHELALLGAAYPVLPALLLAGRFARPMRKVPKLGWIVADPVAAREIYNDNKGHFSIIDDGAAGHWWAQILGDWVYDLFDGRAHTEFRTQVRDLFTAGHGDALVDRVIGDRLTQVTADLLAGATIDVQDLSTVLVGRVLADLVGVEPEDWDRVLPGGDWDRSDPDSPYRALYAQGVRLANLGMGTMTTTTLDPAVVSEARAITELLSACVPRAYDNAGDKTTLGRCRELGVSLQVATGLAILMTVAGTDTTGSAMARMIALLADSGDQHELLADTTAIPDTVRETLRITSPAPLVGRSVAKDVTVAGKDLVAGDSVKILTWTIDNAAGGFRYNRPYNPETRQLWFGGGRHLCLGLHLVHAQLGGLLKAFTDTGRPWEIVTRQYGRKVFVPAYKKLEVRLVS